MKLISQHLCKLTNIGLHGHLFGGQLLSWIDEAGFILAAERARSYALVTAQMDRIDFLQPVMQSEVISIYAAVVSSGRTSLRIQVQAHKNQPDQLTEKTLIAQTFLVFVHIDPLTKKPIPLTL